MFGKEYQRAKDEIVKKFYEDLEKELDNEYKFVLVMKCNSMDNCPQCVGYYGETPCNRFRIQYGTSLRDFRREGGIYIGTRTTSDDRSY